MASIEKRGKNSWRLVVEAGRDAKGRRRREKKTIHVEDKALLRTKKKLRDYLEARLYEFKREVEAGEYIRPQKMLFGDFVETQWKPKYAEKEFAKSTQVTFYQHLRVHILPWFGHMCLRSIKTMHVVDFMNYLATPAAKKDRKNINGGILSGGTRVYILKVLRSVFSAAVEWNFISKNPCDGVRWPKVRKKEVEVYEEEELDNIFQALEKEPIRWRMIILMAFLSGFRREEIVALEMNDLDFENDTIRVDASIPMKIKGKFLVKNPKSEASKRTITMPKWFMDELKKYCTQWKLEKMRVGSGWKGGDKCYLFHSGKGIPYNPNSVTNWWRKFLQRNRIRHIKLHGLRHTSATYLLENGANMKAIQKRLGHADVKTTQNLYLHVTKKEQKKVIKEFDHFRGIK